MIDIIHRTTCSVLWSVDADNLCGADLCGADLRGADLREANLREAIGNGVEVCSLHGPYVAVWTAYNLWIGCQSADHATWWDRDEAFFMRFSDDGAERWAAWKPILQAAIAATTGTRLAN